MALAFVHGVPPGHSMRLDKIPHCLPQYVVDIRCLYPHGADFNRSLCESQYLQGKNLDGDSLNCYNGYDPWWRLKSWT